MLSKMGDDRYVPVDVWENFTDERYCQMSYIPHLSVVRICGHIPMSLKKVIYICCRQNCLLLSSSAGQYKA